LQPSLPISHNFSEDHKPVVPLFKNDDGSINRDKTLALPCYMSLSHT